MTPKQASKQAGKAAKTSRQHALDDLIMATNSSSIVSKRSVERLYYPDEAHFFRYFVKKFQRRAPLINRGYLLRLKAIDTLVRRFLEKPSALKKVVVNLGCGSDVLPWQCETRYPKACEGVTFVDIDYPDLLLKKRQIVLDTKELQQILGIWKSDDNSQVLLESEKYCQVACDLSQLSDLERSLSTLFDLSKCTILFVAEVSITYMDTIAADALIQWASTIGDTEFCLLEQILPDGPSHPFAHTMLKHFDKLNTPLKSVHQYPHLDDQELRFQSRGWPTIQTWTLWEAWADDIFMSPLERAGLDLVEVFDEWEEFALFASHYLVLHASNKIATNAPPTRREARYQSQLPRSPVPMSFVEHSPGRGNRRFGAAMVTDDIMGSPFISHLMGQGTNGRLKSCDIYRPSYHGQNLTSSQLGRHGPAGRTCHTMTDLGDAGVLFVGGRSSPSNAFKDCWLFRKSLDSWDRVSDLPIPLFRHSVVRLGTSSLALLAGGKTDHGSIFPDYLVYNPQKGWIKCNVSGSLPDAVFSPVLVECAGSGRGTFHGLLAGGIRQDGVINQKTFSWELELTETQALLVFQNRTEVSNTPSRDSALWHRFGATCVPCGPHVLLFGGVTSDVLLPQEYDILLVSVTSLNYTIESGISGTSGESHESYRPLLIGSSVVPYRNNYFILGGGATCFSMGTFWNKGSYSFGVDIASSMSPKTLQGVREPLSVVYSGTVEIIPSDPTRPSATGLGPELTVTTIPRVKISSEEAFQNIMVSGKPVVIEASDIGSCVHSWTIEYLIKTVGKEREVVVHESNTDKMDFNSKNFRYVTKDFETFLKEVESQKKLYLRALSTIEPINLPASLSEDYPALVADFQLPPELAYVTKNMFSSVLRISGPVNMWLHYDVMANVYVQVRGSKRLILFPPADVSHLSFAPGASSSSIDVFSSLDSGCLPGVHPYEALVQPGDILFIPPLWPHTATPTTGTSVAVNVFFRSLDTGYSVGKDVYGNRDLAAYERGRQEVARISQNFHKQPRDIREFYLRRLADELLQAISN